MLTKEQVDAIAQQMKAEVDVASKYYGDKSNPWKDGFRYALAELLRRLPDEPKADCAHLSTHGYMNKERCLDCGATIVHGPDGFTVEASRGGPYGGVKHSLEAPPCADPACPICGAVNR